MDVDVGRSELFEARAHSLALSAKGQNQTAVPPPASPSLPQEGGRRLPDLAVQSVVGHPMDVGQPVVGGDGGVMPPRCQLHLAHGQARRELGTARLLLHLEGAQLCSRLLQPHVEQVHPPCLST